MNEALSPDIEVVAVCVPDHFGRLIGKRVPAERWAEVLERGLSMPNFHLVTGIDNVPYTDLAVTGYHTGFRNGLLRPCAAATFRLVTEASTLFALSDALDMHEGKKNLADHDISLHTLSNWDDVLNAGEATAFFSEESRNQIVDFLKDPGNWGRRMGFE